MLVNSDVSLETAKRLMRHEKVELTSSVYTQLGKKNLTQALDKVDPFGVPIVENPPLMAMAIKQNEENLFASKGIELFNDFRAGKISEEEYRKQKEELLNLQEIFRR